MHEENVSSFADVKMPFNRHRFKNLIFLLEFSLLLLAVLSTEAGYAQTPTQSQIEPDTSYGVSQIPQQAPTQTKPVPQGSSLKEESVPTANASHAFLSAYLKSEDAAGTTDPLGSTYIPVDSVVYSKVLRLYSLGYLDTAFINMRPWTRRGLLHRLNAASTSVMADNNDEAVSLLASLQRYIQAEMPGVGFDRKPIFGVDTVYTRFMGIRGQTLHDSYHLGETIANDYGRPYEPGFNNITGFSSVNEVGPFSLYVRGEYQHAPSGAGYSQTLSRTLSTLDGIPYSGYNLAQATIPTGPITAVNTFTLEEATLSYHLLGNEISGGKSDAWLSPAIGGAMGWSNNAQNIYTFRIDRVEPLHVPLLSRLIGPLEYDFYVGSLKGHTDPNSPWVHSETVSIAPTSNVRVSFERVVIWGGEGHEPVTLHSFLRSFFSINDVTPAAKITARDPGARFSSFNFSWRLPYLSHYVTLYTDSTVHDDVTPPSAPRRAAYRPGIYVSQLPGIHKLDFRLEGANSDISTAASYGGSFIYIEEIQKQGYTNKGQLFGDWVGREGKGGQAWLAYHLTADDWIQVEYMHKKTAKDFIAGGTTQNQFLIDAVKRLGKEVELHGWLQYEGWKAPIFLGNTLNKDITVTMQFTWFPGLGNATRRTP